MLLFTADFLKKQGYNINYEFENIEKYLKICKEIQPKKSLKIGSLELIRELIEDLALFGNEFIYIFFEIKKIEELELIYIYDYVDIDYKIEDLKENFAKIKATDLLKLLDFQIA